MKIERIVSSLLDSNMYIIEEDGHTIIFDPCNKDVNISTKKTDYIILTHEHYDHISGVNKYKEITDALVICCFECAENIVDPKKNMSHYFESFWDIQTWTDKVFTEKVEDYSCTADVTFGQEYSLCWQGHNIYFRHTPGHSAGSSCVVVDDKIMFSGDSLIKGYKPSLRFPGGSRKRWNEETVPFLRKIKRDILVYPGHFDSFYLSEYEWSE